MRSSFLLVAALLFVPSVSAARGPAVRPVHLSPLVVRGSGFRGHERVVVTATNGTKRMTLTVGTTVAGSFVARSRRSLKPGTCPHITIRARDSHGGLAVWRTPPQPCGAQP